MKPTQLTPIDDTEVEEQSMSAGWLIASVLIGLAIYGGIYRARHEDRKPPLSGKPPITLTPP